MAVHRLRPEMTKQHWRERPEMLDKWLYLYYLMQMFVADAGMKRLCFYNSMLPSKEGKFADRSDDVCRRYIPVLLLTVFSDIVICCQPSSNKVWNGCFVFVQVVQRSATVGFCVLLLEDKFMFWISLSFLHSMPYPPWRCFDWWMPHKQLISVFATATCFIVDELSLDSSWDELR